MTLKKQRYQLIRKINRLRKSKAVTVVFVCGYGGAGKTTFCKQLASKLEPNAVVFESDWFLKHPTFLRNAKIKTALESRNARKIIEEENPQNWYDWILFTTSLKTLIEERKFELKNAWSQETGNKDLSIKLSLDSNNGNVIICDGIYLLHNSLSGFADYKIMLDVPISYCIENTRNRDAHRSSRAYLEYKVSLLHKYDKPYFEEFKQLVDSTISMPVKELTKSKI